jgi:hypothetical protein
VVGLKEIYGFVYDRPKSALSESFRAIRSSFSISKKAKMDGAKTLMKHHLSVGRKNILFYKYRPFLRLAKKKTVIIGVI